MHRSSMKRVLVALLAGGACLAGLLPSPGPVAAGAQTAPAAVAPAALVPPAYRTDLPGTEPVVDLALVPGHGTVVLRHATGSSTSLVTLVDDAGAPAAGFGGTGTTVVPFAATSLAVTSSGAIVVAGDQLLRLTLSGSPDAGFGTAGVVVPTGGAVHDIAAASGDAVVVLGTGHVARYDATGTLDPSFGTGGTALVPTATASSRLTVTSSGAVVVLVATGLRAERTNLLVRLTATGRADTAFGVGGAATCACLDTPVAIASRQHDDVVVADAIGSVAVFGADGRLLPSFGRDGLVYLDLSDVDVRAVAVDATEGITLAGSGRATNNGTQLAGALLFRFGADGAFDTSNPAACGWRFDGGSTSNWGAIAIDATGGLALGGTLASTATVARQQPSGVVVPVADCGRRYTPIGSARVLDTRIGQGAPTGLVPAGGQIDVQVAGLVGVPTSVAAVSITVTATDAVDAGFVTVWPSGTPRPTTSVVNLERAGDTAATLVTVPVGRDGRVSLFTQRGAHLVIDVSGYVSLSPGLGAFVPTPARRVLDTRVGIGAPAAKLAAHDVLRVDIDPSPYPGAIALMGTLTVTEADADGFASMWGLGGQPVVSNVNVSAGQTRANQAIVSLSADTLFEVYVHMGAHVVFDVTGYFAYDDVVLPPGTATVDIRPVPPTRVLDTRDGTGAPAGRVARGGTLSVPVGQVDGVAADRIVGVVATLTLVDATAAGFVTAWPGGPLPAVSNLNADAPGQTRPVQVVVPVAADGTLQLYVQAGGHVLLDVTGYLVR